MPSPIRTRFADIDMPTVERPISEPVGMLAAMRRGILLLPGWIYG
jgi:hypothetical protein